MADPTIYSATSTSWTRRHWVANWAWLYPMYLPWTTEPTIDEFTRLVNVHCGILELSPKFHSSDISKLCPSCWSLRRNLSSYWISSTPPSVSFPYWSIVVQIKMLGSWEWHHNVQAFHTADNLIEFGLSLGPWNFHSPVASALGCRSRRRSGSNGWLSFPDRGYLFPRNSTATNGYMRLHETFGAVASCPVIYAMKIIAPMHHNDLQFW